MTVDGAMRVEQRPRPADARTTPGRALLRELRRRHVLRRFRWRELKALARCGDRAALDGWLAERGLRDLCRIDAIEALATVIAADTRLRRRVESGPFHWGIELTLELLFAPFV